EAPPAETLRLLAVALAEGLRVVALGVVLAGDVMDVGLDALQDLARRVELGGLREVRDVARVEHEVGRLREGVDLLDRLLDRDGRVGVRLLVEAEVSVADLDEREVGSLGGVARRLL